jgi:hypothetical protein
MPNGQPEAAPLSDREPKTNMTKALRDHLARLEREAKSERNANAIGWETMDKRDFDEIGKPA